MGVFFVFFICLATDKIKKAKSECNDGAIVNWTAVKVFSVIFLIALVTSLQKKNFGQC